MKIVNNVVLIIIFSFVILLMFTAFGCYTTGHYSDTPENIVSGKSEIKMTREFVIEKIIFKTGVIKNFADYYYSAFIKCGDSCSKYIYVRNCLIQDTIAGANPKEIKIIYRNPVSDTINISDIKMMFYRKEEFDGGSLAFVLTALLIVPVGYGIIWLLMHPR